MIPDFFDTLLHFPIITAIIIFIDGMAAWDLRNDNYLHQDIYRFIKILGRFTIVAILGSLNLQAFVL